MAVSAEYRAFVIDLLRAFGPVRIRAMFGGAGVYADLEEGPVMFGLIADETLYLKTDDSNRPAFDAEGCGPFLYEKKDGTVMAMGYCQVPDRLLEDADDLAHWARGALDVALRSDTVKRKRAKRLKNPVKSPA